MFKVDDIRKSAELTKGKSVRKTDSGENFADYLKTSMTKETNQLQSMSAMTSADAIFAAQMIDVDEEKQIRKKLVKKANKLIDCLEEIREGLLFGEFSKDKLIEISRLVKQKDVDTNDPKLREIMEEIELRVEVELAKLMR